MVEAYIIWGLSVFEARCPIWWFQGKSKRKPGAASWGPIPKKDTPVWGGFSKQGSPEDGWFPLVCPVNTSQKRGKAIGLLEEPVRTSHLVGFPFSNHLGDGPCPCLDNGLIILLSPKSRTRF